MGVPRPHRQEMSERITGPGRHPPPGAYAEIQFTLTNPTTALLIPPSVLLINAKGPQVVVLDQENRVEFRPVKLGRDLGREVEILAGIGVEDRLVVSPSDQLRDGEVVEVRVWGG